MVDPNVEYTPVKDIKYCCIPSCKNNTRDTQKLFFTVPNSNKFEWCNAMGIKCPKRVLYLCENHLNLEEDVENYRYWILMKGRPKLKPRLPESLKNSKQINKEINKPRASTRSKSKKVDVTKTLPKNPNSMRVRKGRKVKSNISGDVRSLKNRRVCMKRAINVKEASEMGQFSTETMDIEEKKLIIDSKEPNKESDQERITSTRTVLAVLKSKKPDEGCRLEQIMSKHNYHEDKCIKEETEENELGIKKENAEEFSIAEDNTECCSTEDEEVLTMKCEVFDEPLIPASHDVISGVSHVSSLTLQKKKKGKTNAQRQKEYRQRKKQEKERLNPKKKPKTKAEHQREYRRRKKLEMESLSPKRKPKTRAECKKQFRLKQNMLLQSEQLDSNVARKRVEEEGRIKQENTEDCNLAEYNAEYPSIEEGKITVKCEILEQPLHLSGSENDVTSATAQIQVKLEPQDELPVENSLYFEVPPLIRSGSACNFVTFASELIQVKVEYEEDDRSSSEPLRMEFP